MALVWPLQAGAQWPGELAGRVVDARSGSGLPAARIEVEGVARLGASDASGAFHLRGLEPGETRLVVQALGYLTLHVPVQVRNGEVSRVLLELEPDPLVLPGIRAEARPSGLGAGSTLLEREEIARSGARTAGDLVEAVPGVVVRSGGPGGAQTVSIRGGTPDGVLVLLDGVALNDPLTGEADLSLVSASALENATVLPGGHSARYGPRAESGVILLRSRAPGGGSEVVLGVGSLGERTAGIDVGGGMATRWSVGGDVRSLHGRFPFDLPDRAGGGAGLRENGDLEQWTGRVALVTDVAGGALSLRAAVEGLDRGLPGRGYAPALEARQEMDRVRTSGAWHRGGSASDLTWNVHLRRDALRFRDGAPPAGLPYDHTTTLRSAGTTLELDRVLPLDVLPSLGFRTSVQHQHIRGTGLADDAPRSRVDARAATHLRFRWPGRPVEGALVVGVDHAPDGDSPWVATHELSGSVGLGAATLRAAHRSSFSPPGLSDQYFRAGVGVVPNPDLAPQRVPSETELGLEVRGGEGGVPWHLDVVVFQGDVRGMIVWLPDYRFVWSPRNVDVLRRGGEVSATLAPGTDLRLALRYGLARVVYDRPGDAEPVQVAYRPRHSGGFDATWQPGAWHLSVRGAYTGARYPVPARLNELPAFWSVDAAVGRDWEVWGWSARTTLAVDRVRDERDSLIFAVPEPGRTVRFDTRITPPSFRGDRTSSP